MGRKVPLLGPLRRRIIGGGCRTRIGLSTGHGANPHPGLRLLQLQSGNPQRLDPGGIHGGQQAQEASSRSDTPAGGCVGVCGCCVVECRDYGLQDQGNGNATADPDKQSLHAPGRPPARLPAGRGILFLRHCNRDRNLDGHGPGTGIAPTASRRHDPAVAGRPDHSGRLHPRPRPLFQHVRNRQGLHPRPGRQRDGLGERTGGGCRRLWPRPGAGSPRYGQAAAAAGALPGTDGRPPANDSQRGSRVALAELSDHAGDQHSVRDDHGRDQRISQGPVDAHRRQRHG
mmetsp:Transcript_8339/g.24659  ORF Transcript_8339/g.24659 Transcript_8339/m.24659 type:complete len:286 (-) Transcript_8339:712-1569(-)